MAEHVHGCLNCRPDMVPDFSRDDPRYHDGDKCRPFRLFLDGVEPGYTNGALEGAEGWVLLASEGFNAEQVHPCPNCTTYAPHADPDGYRPLERYEVCVEPRFGKVDVIHECRGIRRHATGGSVRGPVYVLGENGPESFAPTTSGVIVPVPVWKAGNDGPGSGLDS